ncbi:hypothetical protein [Blastococcus sp. VKM Ac-2987]|uniref:hypothetical protein n=1 Tax=Blastococcus sp. VKM Ac-2987 TaxID=3004141 RepID=UPI0022AB53A8|nr:hypothetical protein [Blastococcus sp. VKM Ac-2987]MCZ2857505.1 hypothetical protein [Blastococcus sp. VKM Ac-2987]
MTRRRRDLVAGALGGYVASRTMDVATRWFYRRHSEATKIREEELAPGGTLVQLGKKLGGATGRDLDDEAAGRVGLAVHRSFGVTYGVLAAALTRRGMRPLAAGLCVGAGAFLVVDEGTALPLLTAYPLESHARGVVGHATLGLVTGVLLELLDVG